jgi:hypothetical protein
VRRIRQSNYSFAIEKGAMLAWPLFAFGPRIDYSDDELPDSGMTHPHHSLVLWFEAANGRNTSRGSAKCE